MVETFLAESTRKRHTKDKPFITDKIKLLIINRNKAYRSGKMELYRALRAQVSKEILRGTPSSIVVHYIYIYILVVITDR